MPPHITKRICMGIILKKSLRVIFSSYLLIINPASTIYFIKIIVFY